MRGKEENSGGWPMFAVRRYNRIQLIYYCTNSGVDRLIKWCRYADLFQMDRGRVSIFYSSKWANTNLYAIFLIFHQNSQLATHQPLSLIIFIKRLWKSKRFKWKEAHAKENTLPPGSNRTETLWHWPLALLFWHTVLPCAQLDFTGWLLERERRIKYDYHLTMMWRGIWSGFKIGG